jgi:hypothetical protein
MNGKQEQGQHSNRHSTIAKERQQQLIAFFVVGLCAGIIISERLYIRSSRAALLGHGQHITLAAPKQQLVDYKFMRGRSASTSSSSAATVSTAAVAGALAAQVAAAEAAAVAAISEQLVRTDPQLRELEAYLRKVCVQGEWWNAVLLVSVKMIV